MDGYRPKIGQHPDHPWVIVGDGICAGRSVVHAWIDDALLAEPTTEAAAQWLMAELALARRASAPAPVSDDAPSDPSTEGMLVRSGQWLIDNDPDGKTWERLGSVWVQSDGGWLRDHRHAIPDRLYIVRRIRPAPPEPEVEKVSWGVDLIGRKVDGQAEPINFVGTHRSYGYCTTEVVWFARCPESESVSVLVDRATAPSGEQS